VRSEEGFLANTIPSIVVTRLVCTCTLSLSLHIVTMTVFLADSRYTTRMTEIRTEIFGEDFPASAAITVTGFADPVMLMKSRASRSSANASQQTGGTRMSAIGVGARLDRLPVTRLHRKVFNLIGVGMFFEGGSISTSRRACSARRTRPASRPLPRTVSSSR
jgi:hypothetical protein